tara:strand:+ start:4238 stop:4678 length:441 start_codon:yes stop_codon:yes gene_type:complete
MKNKQKQSFNDRMVKRTVLPTIYLWLLAAGSVVAMGIWKPDVVLMNLDGFIALLAIISGVAVPALGTVLRMWESEQTQEVDNIPTELKHDRDRDAATKEHIIELEKIAQKHEHLLAQMAQEHAQEMDKIRADLKLTTLEPVKKKKA